MTNMRYRLLSSSFLHLEDDTKSFIGRLLLASCAGIILGRSEWKTTLSSSSSWFFQRDDASAALIARVVVPVYVMLSLLYLSAVAFRQDLVHFWKRRHKKSKVSRDEETLAVVPTSASVTIPLEVLPSSAGGAGLLKDQPVDLTGAYRLVSNENFEGFLAAQGVPWALRNAANRARPLHRITHRGRVLTIKIEGIIESQTTYLIDGPPVETNVRGRIFEDVVNYLGDGKRGIVVRKKALTEDYDVTVQRELSEDGTVITMTSTATFRDDRPFVQSKQIFHKVIE
jgi:hypothetical protein